MAKKDFKDGQVERISPKKFSISHYKRKVT